MAAPSAAGSAGSRQEQKERTRVAILDAALRLSEESGLAGLSLRAVAKEVGIVPTAFYRHFASIDELGLALVDECFASLRQVLRDVRREEPSIDQVIARSVAILARNVRERHAQFTFIDRERSAGPPAVRQAVLHELELFERELAMDLLRLTGGVMAWSTEDLHALCNLIVGAMVNTAAAILASGRPEAEAQVVARAETQLRMVVIGAVNWQSRE